MDKTLTFSAEDFARALDQHDYTFQVGQTVKGRVSGYDGEGAYIDIGGKAAAFLPETEVFLRADQKLTDALPLDTEREFLIIRGQNADGQVTLSIRRLELKALWERLQDLQAQNQAVEVRVAGVNKGGVTVDVEGLRGFIPRSHLVERENLDALVGQRLAANFLEVDPERKKLVLSNRQALRATRISTLELGQLVTGQVRELRPFGAFIDLDGVTGLLHIQEVSQKYVASLASLLPIGTSVKAIVLDIEPGRGRISLSTKALEQHPGEVLENWEQVMEDAENRAQHYQEKLPAS